MGLRRRIYSIELNADEARKLDWTVGRAGRSAHAQIRTLVRDWLALQPEPPDGYGRPCGDDDPE